MELGCFAWHCTVAGYRVNGEGAKFKLRADTRECNPEVETDSETEEAAQRATIMLHSVLEEINDDGLCQYEDTVFDSTACWTKAGMKAHLCDSCKSMEHSRREHREICKLCKEEFKRRLTRKQKYDD